MRHPLSHFGFILALSLFSLSALPAHAQALSLDELVAKNVAARGGAAALQAMKTLKLSGKLLVNQGQFELGLRTSVQAPLQGTL